MRLLFIHGFGEDETIFEKLHPLLSGNKLFLNNWQLLGNTPRPELNVQLYARELVEKYSIGPEDVVIGHSLGGWIALHIKQQAACTSIQIASWTDSKKINSPITHPGLIYWCVKRNIYFNPLIRQLLIYKDYRNKPSEAVFRSVFDRLMQGSNENVINQLRLIFTPVAEPAQVQPDLRIHARRDTIVGFPQEATHAVPGDHFTLYTAPELVAAPILQLLKEKQTV